MSDGDLRPGGRDAGPVVRYFLAVPKTIIASLILVSIALNFVNVVARYAFGDPIAWAEEVMIFIMIWCVFIGAILVSWDGSHLKMDLISVTLRAPWKQALNSVTTAVMLGICGFVALQSYDASMLFARLGQKSVVAELPMAIAHGAITLGFLALTVVVAVRFRSYVVGSFGAGSGISFGGGPPAKPDEPADTKGGG
jgi:TRAP-type C4-dicarboxylate transport system permease small subunit